MYCGLPALRMNNVVVVCPSRHLLAHNRGSIKCVLEKRIKRHLASSSRNKGNTIKTKLTCVEVSYGIYLLPPTPKAHESPNTCY